MRPSKPAAARILVVEDDFLIRMMLAEVLADDGFEVIEAETADDAVALLETDISLLLTDMQMPGMLNGRDLVNLARKSHPDLPVIFTSGRIDPSIPDGPRDMAIAKPYQTAEICAAVRRLLAI